VEALGSCPVCPPLNPALAFEFRRGSLTRLHQTAVIVISMDSRQVRLVVKVGRNAGTQLFGSQKVPQTVRAPMSKFTVVF